MAKTFDNEYKNIVLQIISSIPQGKVASYGEIAKLAGKPNGARQIGFILKNLPKNTTLPWYRVVNSHGRISLTGENYTRQYTYLINEGVIFKKCHMTTKYQNHFLLIGLAHKFTPKTHPLLR
ncbi:MGMT family protein [Thorsellia anophelis]|uniref:Methylated-DNA-protein-cysteine methyltransferase related protein n=1 Tax=Thorsellia anophelis DSM 18579 TaxID=1123402 RepID=A0A1I0CRE3_9GAMM|nr:MGMT family protein [Thorsellia anophelis]SET22335.1 methylated-DNA-protein-cysteine methyltransferase related protein [Thorsellia anophelis DSM 18579]